MRREQNKVLMIKKKEIRRPPPNQPTVYPRQARFRRRDNWRSLVMRSGILILTLTIFGVHFADLAGAHRTLLPAQATRALQPNTLCAKDERVIFACWLKQP